MNCLDLFSGTHSFAKCCKELGHNCLTLDRDLPADINIDIMDWDYKSFKPNEFDIIWASPPCVAYSMLRKCNLNKTLKDGTVLTLEQLEKDMNESDKVVQRTLDIINYFKPHWWFMENPQTAKLKDRDVVKGLPFYDVDYCKYSDFGYKKRTRIWTNREGFTPRLCKNDCENMIVIKTNGAVHTGTKQPIKSDTRLLHKNPMGDNNKCKEIKKQNLHVECVGCSKMVLVNGKIIKVNKKHLRDKYKNYPNIMTKKHKANVGGGAKDSGQINVGGGTNRLQRYRVPRELIFSLLLE